MITIALSLIWQVATSRLGMVVIAGTVAWHVAYNRGYSTADQSAQLASVQSQLEITSADLKAARLAERIAASQAEQLADISLQQQEYLDDLESSLADRPERAVCRVTDADVERLRRIDTGEGGGQTRPAPLSILSPAGNRPAAKGR